MKQTSKRATNLAVEHRQTTLMPIISPYGDFSLPKKSWPNLARFGQKWIVYEKMPNFQRLVSPTGQQFLVNVFSPLEPYLVVIYGEKIKFLNSWVLGVKTADPKLPILTHRSSHRWRPLAAKVMK